MDLIRNPADLGRTLLSRPKLKNCWTEVGLIGHYCYVFYQLKKASQPLSKMADHHKILVSTKEAFEENKATKFEDLRPVPCAKCVRLLFANKAGGLCYKAPFHSRCWSCMLLGAVCSEI